MLLVKLCVCVRVVVLAAGVLLQVCVAGLKRLNPGLAAVRREDPSVERSRCREASSVAPHLHGSLSCSGELAFSFPTVPPSSLHLF